MDSITINTSIAIMDSMAAPDSMAIMDHMAIMACIAMGNRAMDRMGSMNSRAQMDIMDLQHLMATTIVL